MLDLVPVIFFAVLLVARFLIALVFVYWLRFEIKLQRFEERERLKKEVEEIRRKYA